MNWKKSVVLAMALVITVMAISSCTTFDNFKNEFFSKKGAAADTVKIGVLEPETGTDSQNGQKEIEGIKMANQVVNQVLGKKVELVYADTQSSMDVTESAVQDLIAKKPVVVLGSYGEAVTMVAGKFLEEAKIPAITITATNPLITSNNDYYFRVNFTDTSQGKAIAEYVHNKLLAETASVVVMKNDDSATSLVSQFTKTFTSLTEKSDSVAARVTIDPDETNYEEYINRLIASETRAIFVPVSLKTADKIFAQASKQKYFTPTFIGPKEWHGEELIGLQKKYPGIRIAVASDFNATMEVNLQTEETNAYYDQFVKAYETKYPGQEPEEATALAFDAYMIAIQAIEQAQSIDGFLVKEALKTTKGFKGASGTISFDESGEPKKTINIDVIRGDKFVSVYTID